MPELACLQRFRRRLEHNLAAIQFKTTALLVYNLNIMGRKYHLFAPSISFFGVLPLVVVRFRIPVKSPRLQPVFRGVRLVLGDPDLLLYMRLQKERPRFSIALLAILVRFEKRCLNQKSIPFLAIILLS